VVKWFDGPVLSSMVVFMLTIHIDATKVSLAGLSLGAPVEVGVCEARIRIVDPSGAVALVPVCDHTLHLQINLQKR